MQVVDVNIPNAAYKISIERGLVSRVAQLVADGGLNPTAVALVVDDAVAANYGAAVERSFKSAGVRTQVIPLHASEESKTLATVQMLCQRMLESGLDRRSAVIAVGGGVVGDIAGFAAAVFMRGIAWVQVPTTLLAMVDASIGGKTAVNLARVDGTLAKNMVGAFWQPRAVLCDPEVLSTLPMRERTCGFAECIKQAVIGDRDLLGCMAADEDWLKTADADACARLIARSAAVKALIVARDEREDGPRALLNLGHTFAHAIESLDHASVKHGEAVAIGMTAALHAAGGLERSDPAKWRSRDPEMIMTIEMLGLPTRLPRPLPVAALMAAMQGDKKSIGGKLRLVLPFGAGDVRVVDGVEPSIVQAAWRAVGAT